MHGRYFGGQRITAEFYDGRENFHREESEEMKTKREQAWAKWLEEGDE